LEAFSRLVQAGVEKCSVRALAAALGAKGDRRGMVRAMANGYRAPQTAKYAWRMGEALRACGVEWASGFLTLELCGFGREWVALLDAIDRENQLNGAWLWYATLAARVLESQTDLARSVLSKVWREIGDDALEQAWDETQKARFRPHGLAALAFSVLDQDDIPEDARQRVLRVVIDEWAREHWHLQLIDERISDLFAPRPMPDPYLAILAGVTEIGKKTEVKGYKK